MIKQEPGSPLQRAVKQEAVKQEEQQGTGCFLADHGLLECLETYLDPQCFPGADFEIDVSTAWAVALLSHCMLQHSD
jgi:hypothetical protein